MQLVWSRAGDASRVHGITCDWMTDRREMNADLMRAPGLEVDLEQRPRCEALANPVARDRRPSGWDDGHARIVAWVATDRRLDAPVLSRHLAVHEREIGFLD